MIDFDNAAFGIGIGDIQLAVHREAVRLRKETHGNHLAMELILIAKMQDLGLISEDEVEILTTINDIAVRSANGRLEPEEAYHEVRRIYDEMLATGKASPVALVSAGSAAESYISIEDYNDKPTIVYKAKSSGTWEGIGNKIGILIGAKLGGPAGAVLGGMIGGAIGNEVDEKRSEEDGE
ncbi:hypothetical protein [Candidatus Leptofilum sp.]|uniref:hypothetical protein n=1 Tax=Candidatus Leptofilum sp. TaxID=3241576 RepID=UPI003B5BC244